MERRIKRNDWFISDGKSQILQSCWNKEISHLILGIQTQQLSNIGKLLMAFCKPEFPKHNSFGCNNYKSTFFKKHLLIGLTYEVYSLCNGRKIKIKKDTKITYFNSFFEMQSFWLKANIT